MAKIVDWEFLRTSTYHSTHPLLIQIVNVSHIPVTKPFITDDLEKEQESHAATKDELAAVNAEIDDI